ncbi:hypothetical protein BDY21DRAFT_351428 [Lineolata rhizophorae]|uniref:Uncharacterized protein n=1 Tax=Lineolata rhizophorae TaxID=578093 RepID=A0A6A6NTT6_9PEZI|nr:hypothetical protein BDY21DRAFT_351428 [Lineolata rhizophorae]
MARRRRLTGRNGELLERDFEPPSCGTDKRASGVPRKCSLQWPGTRLRLLPLVPACPPLSCDDSSLAPRLDPAPGIEQAPAAGRSAEAVCDRKWRMRCPSGGGIGRLTWWPCRMDARRSRGVREITEQREGEREGGGDWDARRTATTTYTNNPAHTSRW